jgi:DNA-binding LacI/PurR family transcriptional regulator
MAKKVIEKIAGEAGVSVATVHRLLANGTKDKRPTFVKRAKLVADLAARYNYHPSAAAKSMRSRRSNNIGLLLGPESHRSYVTQELLQGILDELNQQQRRLVVARISEASFASEDAYPRMLSELSCDGLLVNYQSETPTDLSQILEKLSLPSIWINDDKAGDCVRPNDSEAAKCLTRKLLEQGHRKIAYVDMGFEAASETRHYSKLHREAGYEEVMSAIGEKPIFISDKGVADDPSARLARLASSIAENDYPTAYVCYETEWRRIEYLYRQIEFAGRAVPALATFGSESEAQLAWPITCAVVPQYEVGQNAVEMIIEKVAAPTEVLPTRKLDFTILN